MNSPGTMMQKRAWLLALVTGLVAGAPGASAQQQQQMPQQAADAGQAQVASANVEVTVLHATNADGGGSIDPAIGPMPALQKPPFSAYNTYKLVTPRTTIVVSRSAPTTTKLPNGRVLQITLRDVVQANRYRIATSINQPGGTTFLPLLEVTTPAGDPFFVAGQAYQGGMLVIGIKVIK
jgi:hypothetical protein